MTKLVKVDEFGNVHELHSEYFIDWPQGHAKRIPIDHPDNSIINSKLVDDAITTRTIKDLNVTTDKIADSNVTTIKIADSNVTTDKINNSAVTTNKIANSNVTTEKIADLNVTTDKINNSAVTTAKIADNNVTTNKINNSAVTTDKISDLNVTASKLENNLDLRQKTVLVKTPAISTSEGELQNATGFENFYTKTVVDSKLSSKSDIGHTHTVSNITNFPTAIKNPQPLTINGQSYDGSSQMSFNVTTTDYISGLVSEVNTDIMNLLNQKSDINHYHLIDNVFGLENRISELENQIKELENRAYPYIFIKGRFVDNDQDLNSEFNKVPSFQQIFNSWERFSTVINDSQKNSWDLDTANNKVICTVNSANHIGFISLDKYENYIHEVVLSSIDSDDDTIGIVIAYIGDSTNQVPTNYITAVRCTTGNEVKWGLVYNFRLPDQKILTQLDNSVIDKNLNGLAENNGATGWNAYPQGVKIRIERNGDIIKAWTSHFQGTTSGMNALVLDSASELTVNLSSVPELAPLKGAQKYGYSCFSQNESTFSNISFVNRSDFVSNIHNNKVYERVGNNWLETGKLEHRIGGGKLLYNPETKKLFFFKNSNEYERVLL